MTAYDSELITNDFYLFYYFLVLKKIPLEIRKMTFSFNFKTIKTGAAFSSVQCISHYNTYTENVIRRC